MKGSGQYYKLEQHQNLVFMCHISEQHDYCHLRMFSVFIHIYCSYLFTVKFSICSVVVLMVQGLHLCIRLG